MHCFPLLSCCFGYSPYRGPHWLPTLQGSALVTHPTGVRTGYLPYRGPQALPTLQESALATHPTVWQVLVPLRAAVVLYVRRKWLAPNQKWLAPNQKWLAPNQKRLAPMRLSIVALPANALKIVPIQP